MVENSVNVKVRRVYVRGPAAIRAARKRQLVRMCRLAQQWVKGFPRRVGELARTFLVHLIWYSAGSAILIGVWVIIAVLLWALITLFLAM